MEQSKELKQIPTIEEIVDQFPAFQQRYKQAKKQFAEQERIMAARTRMKQIFEKRVPTDQTWNPDAVNIQSYNEGMHHRHQYGYRDAGIVIDYLSRITWCHDDCDTFVDVKVTVHGIVVYQQEKDEVVIDKT
jgi:hypothetical protein